MADKELTVGLRATKDTDAIDETIKQVEELDKAGAEASKSLGDVGKNAEPEIEKTRKSLEGADETLQQMGNHVEMLQRRTQALALVQLSRDVGQLGGRIKEIAAGLDGELSASLKKVGTVVEETAGMMQGLANGFAAGGPLGAVVTGAGLGVAKLVDAYGDADKAMKAAEASANNAYEQWQKLQRLRAAMPNIDLAETYREEADETERQLRNLERISRLRQGLAGAGAEVLANDVTQARQQGQDTTGEEGALILARTTEQLENWNEQVKQAEVTFTLASQKLAAAQNELKAAATRDLPTEKLEEAVKLQEQMKADAAQAVDDMRALAQASREAVVDSHNTEMAGLKQTAVSGLAAVAAETRDEIAAYAAQSGQELSGVTRQGLASITKILADGIVRPEETASLVAAIQAIRTTREGADKEILALINRTMGAAEAITKEIPSLELRMQSLESQIKGLAGIRK